MPPTATHANTVAAPLIIAHRGASHDAPENTLAAFKLAWQQGADGIEGDFRLTRDGEIVCLHDDNSQRTAGRKLTVATATLAELRELDVGIWKGKRWAGERIPTLTEILATVPEDKRIFVELKSGPEIIPALHKVLANAGLQPVQVVFIAFDAMLLAQVKEELPQHMTLWLTGFEKGTAAATFKPTPQEVLDTLTRLHADGVDGAAGPALDAALVGLLRRHGKQVHAWVVNDRQTATQLTALGAASLTTDQPALLGSAADRKPQISKLDDPMTP